MHLSMDFITGLPQSGPYNAILVVAHHGLTKGMILFPIDKEISATETTQIFLSEIFKRFGLPDSLISDRGPQFASAVFQEFMKLLGIQSKLSTTYHFQTDGTTKHFNQEIETYLSIYCISNPSDWHLSLPLLKFTHNS